ncbi:MAG: hypothetical protein PWR16_49 [Methanoculleus sp.]|nr:hypothetical protein [Methanoculleus sp.]
MSRTGVPSSASINGTGDACGGIDAENRNRRERDRVRPDRRPGGEDPDGLRALCVRLSANSLTPVLVGIDPIAPPEHEYVAESLLVDEGGPVLFGNLDRERSFTGMDSAYRFCTKLSCIHIRNLPLCTVADRKRKFLPPDAPPSRSSQW